MKVSRRNFVKTGIIAGSGLLTNSLSPKSIFSQKNNLIAHQPFVISTWDFGKNANSKTLELLLNGENSLDAIEAGINIIENDPCVNSVGYGGKPDEDGVVTLDASIMDWNGNAGSVAGLEGIANPISVAKLVMQKTKHVMLVGDGAQKFALQEGFKKENLLTEEAKQEWLKWKHHHSDNNNLINSKNNHDTIGMLAIDAKGNMSGGVSTSGMAFKMHGRAGDSPIIGAAMYVDNEIGGAAATGNGEFMMKTLTSFLVVEKMREGFSPQESCEIAVRRVYNKYKDLFNCDMQIGLIAANKNAEFGAFSLYQDFVFAVADANQNQVYQSNHLI